GHHDAGGDGEYVRPLRAEGQAQPPDAVLHPADLAAALKHVLADVQHLVEVLVGLVGGLQPGQAGAAVRGNDLFFHKLLLLSGPWPPSFSEISSGMLYHTATGFAREFLLRRKNSRRTPQNARSGWKCPPPCRILAVNMG